MSQGADDAFTTAVVVTLPVVTLQLTVDPVFPVTVTAVEAVPGVNVPG